MKKEDLCMLLIVIVLVLLISQKTNIFEGFGADSIPSTMDEMIDMIGGEPSTPPVAMPPTPTPPQPRAMPPTPTPPQPRAMPPGPGAQATPSPFGTPLMDEKKGAFGQGWVGAFDGDSNLFAPAGSDLGEKIPVSMQQEYLTMKSLGTLTPQIMQNIEEKRTPGSVTGSDFKPFDPSSTSGSLLDAQFENIQVGIPQPGPPQPGPPQPGPPQPGPPQPGPPQPGPPQPGPPRPGPPGGGGVEVHMVYGSWCGHSKRAMPAFEELVSDTSVTTANGSPVKFVMTEDTSPGMEQFKTKVRGFPTYMVVKGDGSMMELEGHDRSKAAIVAAVKGVSA
jgi:thiol-disulfide isomerase/thioredoxin